MNVAIEFSGMHLAVNALGRRDGRNQLKRLKINVVMSSTVVHVDYLFEHAREKCLRSKGSNDVRTTT